VYVDETAVYETAVDETAVDDIAVGELLLVSWWSFSIHVVFVTRKKPYSK